MAGLFEHIQLLQDNMRDFMQDLHVVCSKLDYSEKDRLVASYRAQIEQQTEEIKSLQEVIKSNHKQIKELENQQLPISSTGMTIGELNAMRTTIESLTYELNKSRQDYEMWTNELAQLRELAREKDMNIDILNNHIAYLKEKIADQRKKIRSIKTTTNIKDKTKDKIKK